ncbi:hypothetical protein [Micromonospora echinospora]|uniref:hypothetical protein n=1 Tax=Micromonospora echinospora TaxID=1877 RepID=UPI00366C3EA5
MNNDGYYGDQSSGYEASSSSSGRSSPAPGDVIQVEWSEGATSQHKYDDANSLMTYVEQTGRWVYERNESVINSMAAFVSPAVQGAAGLASNTIGTGAGVAIAAAPGLFRVGAEAVRALRSQSAGLQELLGAAAGALQSGGALAWGVGSAGGASTTVRDVGAIAHGAGAGLMALHTWNRERQQSRQEQVLPLYNHPGAHLDPSAQRSSTSADRHSHRGSRHSYESPIDPSMASLRSSSRSSGYASSRSVAPPTALAPRPQEHYRPVRPDQERQSSHRASSHRSPSYAEGQYGHGYGSASSSEGKKRR